MADSQRKKLIRKIIVIYIIWGVLIFAIPPLGVFTLENDPTPGLILTLFIFLPGAALFVWYLCSPTMRQFILSLDARKVTKVQWVRWAGPVFYLGVIFKVFPATFGIPAVILDMTWGVSVPLALRWWAKAPFPKRAFAWWHIAGILELGVLATLRLLTLPTSLGILAGDVTSEGLAHLPWSLFPNFIAPNLVICHLICALIGFHGASAANQKEAAAA